MSATVRIPAETLEDVQLVAALQKRAPGVLLAEAWAEYAERNREQLASEFERAAEMIRSRDAAGLAAYLSSSSPARAKEAATRARARREGARREAEATQAAKTAVEAKTASPRSRTKRERPTATRRRSAAA